MINACNFRPRNSSLSFPSEDGEDVEEEADEVVPDGVEEVELAKINLERKEREQRLIVNDIRKLSLYCDGSDLNPEKDGEMWMISGGKTVLVSNILDYSSYFIGLKFKSKFSLELGVLWLFGP